MGRQRQIGLSVGLILLSLGLWLTWVDNFRQVPTEIIRVARSAEQTLVARLYLPSLPSLPSRALLSSQPQAPYPTVMLWHGVNCTKETMEPLAIELARQGIVVLATDAGGFGESYSRPFSEDENLADARAIATYVAAHPQRFDPHRIAVGGHSMGGATALTLASENSQIMATLVLGMSADINRYLPPNLFLGIGLYEQFHTPKIMRSMMQQGTGRWPPDGSIQDGAIQDEPIQDGQIYGDFSQGTARQLVISPTADHLMEPFDATLIKATVSWARQAFALQTPVSPLRLLRLLWGQWLILVGGLLTCSYGLRGNAWAQRYPRAIAVGLVALVLLVLALGMTRALPEGMATDLMLLAAVLFPMGHYAIHYPGQLTALFRIATLYGALTVVVYTVVAIAFRSDELVMRPSFLLGLGSFMLHMPIALFYSRLQEVRAALFSVYSDGILPTWGLALLFLPDLIKPAVVVRQTTRGAVQIARWLRQPLQLHWKEPPSPRSLQLLAGLVVLLLAVVYQQVQAGAFSLEYAESAIKLLVQMAIVPGLLIFGMMRSPWFQQLERLCWKQSSSSLTRV